MIYRVSTVESYRQWRDDPDSDPEALHGILTSGIFETEAMKAGTAFHKALEIAQSGEIESLGADGYTFTMAGDFVLALPEIRELRASKTYMVDGEPITISGQIDAMDGHRIDDHKTTARFDPDRYLTGYQWRLYLDIFGANQFRWNIFEIAVKDDPFEWEVFAAHKLEQFRYPSLASDCHELVADFARTVRQLEFA